METPLAFFVNRMREKGLLTASVLNGNLILTDAIEMEEKTIKEFAMKCLIEAESKSLTITDFESIIDKAYEQKFD